MEEKNILELVTSDFSWEQIIYKIIAWEGMDPWELDLVTFSTAFMKYISKIKELDFKVPAKYIIVAATLLKMKSDHLHLIDFVNDLDGQSEEGEFLEEAREEIGEDSSFKFNINPITVPPIRRSSRQVTINELVIALRKALKTEERRTVRIKKATGHIKISREDISDKINKLYDKINNILTKIKDDEVKFSSIVDNWERKEIVDHFIPLLHLDNDKKINCQQEEMFDEILIRKSNNNVKQDYKKTK
ncbi:MAG: segregation/condensation protein A [Candidatus Aenigmatarchaeota archaeon]